METKLQTYYCGQGCRRESMMNLAADGRECIRHARTWMTEAAYRQQLMQEV